MIPMTSPWLAAMTPRVMSCGRAMIMSTCAPLLVLSCCSRVRLGAVPPAGAGAVSAMGGLLLPGRAAQAGRGARPGHQSVRVQALARIAPRSRKRWWTPIAGGSASRSSWTASPRRGATRPPPRSPGPTIAVLGEHHGPHLRPAADASGHQPASASIPAPAASASRRRPTGRADHLAVGLLAPSPEPVLVLGFVRVDPRDAVHLHRRREDPAQVHGLAEREVVGVEEAAACRSGRRARAERVEQRLP